MPLNLGVQIHKLIYISFEKGGTGVKGGEDNVITVKYLSAFL